MGGQCLQVRSDWTFLRMVNDGLDVLGWYKQPAGGQCAVFDMQNSRAYMVC